MRRDSGSSKGEESDAESAAEEEDSTTARLLPLLLLVLEEGSRGGGESESSLSFVEAIFDFELFLFGLLGDLATGVAEGLFDLVRGGTSTPRKLEGGRFRREVGRAGERGV